MFIDSKNLHIFKNCSWSQKMFRNECSKFKKLFAFSKTNVGNFKKCSRFQKIFTNMKEFRVFKICSLFSKQFEPHCSKPRASLCVPHPLRTPVGHGHDQARALDSLKIKGKGPRISMSDRVSSGGEGR